MNFKKVLIGCLLFFSVSSFAQDIDNNWVFGAGGSVVIFSKTSTAFPSERFNFQIPNANLTRYIKNGFSVGIGMKIPAIKKIESIYVNSFDVLYIDLYGRYDFNMSKDRLVPYITAGISSLVKDSNSKATGANFGGGATYWITKKIGVNVQVNYNLIVSDADSAFEMHPQFYAGIVLPFSIRSSSGGHGFCSY